MQSSIDDFVANEIKNWEGWKVKQVNLEQIQEDSLEEGAGTLFE